MKTTLKKSFAIFMTLAMVLSLLTPVFPVLATESGEGTANANAWDFSEASQLSDFALYQSSTSQFTVADGYLVPDGTNGQMKALLKNTPQDIQSLAVDIYPGASGLINVGVYVGASNAANKADEINAEAFLIQSDFSGWDDAPNRIDIIHGTFSGGWTEQGRTISETGNQNNLFSGGEKKPLHLNLEFRADSTVLTLSLIDDPAKSVQCVYNSSDLSGQIGFRANASDAKFDNLILTCAPKQEESQYAYEGNFSQSAEPVNELPAGWVRHPNFKNGTLYQQDGALYFDTLTASGVCAAYYDQDDYTDYMIEADITMLDKTNTARWMGLGYRMNSDEYAVNIFNLTWNNNCATSSYYGNAVTGYDGSVINRGWSTADGKYFVKQTFSATNFPEVLNAGQSKVNLKLVVVGNQITGYVNGVKILECITHNQTQETGSFGIVTSNANIKIENFRVTDLTPKEEPEESKYAYEGNFSQSADPVDALPEGWIEHPYYKNGTLYQQNGALYFDTLTASGICAAYYEQEQYTDYLVEADFTMLDRKDDNRWMGFIYRADADENATNMFVIKYNNITQFTSYYGVAVEGYDGSTISRGWAPMDNKYFVQDTSPADKYPELADAAKTTVHLKLSVIGKELKGYVNDVLVLETTIHNPTQALGSFGIASANTIIKVENYRVTDLTPEEEPEPEIERRNAYAYEAEFAQQETTQLPEGWVRHPSYKNGTLTQKNGALYFNALDASGVCAAYYEQNMYTDYLVEADFTMLDRTDNNRWMGFIYRADSTETANNMFTIKYNNTAIFDAYYGSAVTGYDGTVLNRGWATQDGVHFVKNTLPADQYPTLVDAAKGTVHLQLAVIGNKMYGFVNGVKVLEAVTHNETQALGSFGVTTANTNTKIENFKVIDLSELNQSSAGNAIAHGLSLPTSDAVSDAALTNYIAETTIDFTADSTAKVMIAKAGKTELYATVTKSGAVSVYKDSQLLFTTQANIANPTNCQLKITYANGVVKLTLDGTDLGYAMALDVLPGQFGFASDGAVLKSAALYQTVTNVCDLSFTSQLGEIPYNTTPDWTQLHLTCKLSDGSIYEPQITESMISGFDPTVSGTQTLTVTYEHGGKTYKEKFNVTVQDDPANKPLAKVGIISDVHIGANASNMTALEEALAYYKAKGVDAIVCVGDIGHDKMEYLDSFNEAVQKVFPNGTDTVKIYVMGNHDTYAFNNAGFKVQTEEHNAAVEDYFANTFGVSVDSGRAGINYYKVINDYVFAGLYIQTPIEEREAFLEEVFALPEAQGKPVFLVMHEIPIGSVYIAKYNPNSTSETDMHEILKSYPNAVVLAGHSHNPLADERALWQGEYTVVSCGSLFGPTVEEHMYEGGSVNGSFQPGNWGAKHALFMEIRNGGINIERYDFTNDQKLGKDWFIPVNDGVVDLTPYNYELRTQAAVAPEFDADAQVVAEPISESMIRITFPGSFTEYAAMDDIVHSYIIRAYNDQTGELVGTKRVLSQHYLGRVPEKATYTITYTGLNSATDYRFEIVAVESYQKESEALVVKADTKKFSTEGLTATFYANFDYAWDAQEFDFYNHNSSNVMEMVNGAISAKASNSSKAILKDLTFATGTIDTMISMNNSGANINSGIYLFASNAADEQDTINAYNVHVDSSSGSKDLQVALYKFTGKYDSCLTSIKLTDYFADGNAKANVHLKLEVSNSILSIFVDGRCVLTHSVGAMSGAVGLRSHYAGSDFDYIRVFESSTEYTAPDAKALDTVIEEAREVLNSIEVENTENYTGENPYVTQQTYAELDQLVNAYDVALIRSYERHIVQVVPILEGAVETFRQNILQPKAKVAKVGDVEFTSVADAIAHGGVVELLADSDEAIVIDSDVTIDLAGNNLSNVTVGQGKLMLIDTCTGGTAAVTGNVETFTEVDGITYLVVGEDNVYSAHSYDVTITHITLDPKNDALGYKAALVGDETVQGYVVEMGFNLWVTEDQVITRTKAASAMTLRLKNILANNGGEMDIHATAFVTFSVNGQTYTKTCGQQTTSMKQTLQMVDAAWSGYSDAQKTAVRDLCNRFSHIIEEWNLENIFPVIDIPIIE
ncbi:MAG: metallophosphoesterase [Oscillospiraceae bacterium]|nr:metallophosphoesterase [Oscillospiraceae bacterium]